MTRPATKAKRQFNSSRRVTKRFYVGAQHIADAINCDSEDEWTRATIEEAVEHARWKMDEDDLDCAIVVQIVRVLRREPRPVKVEVVK